MKTNKKRYTQVSGKKEGGERAGRYIIRNREIEERGRVEENTDTS